MIPALAEPSAEEAAENNKRKTRGALRSSSLSGRQGASKKESRRSREHFNDFTPSRSCRARFLLVPYLSPVITAENILRNDARTAHSQSQPFSAIFHSRSFSALVLHER